MGCSSGALAGIGERKHWRWGGSSRGIEEGVEAVGHGVVGVVVEMAVAVEGEGDGRVAGPGGDLFRVGAGADQQRDVGVPQVVLMPTSG